MSDIKDITHNDEHLLNYHGLELREYQIKIAKECKHKNSLVVLPTGLGKTIIAVLVTSEILKTVPTDSKIIVLAPTRPLIDQHYKIFAQFLNLPEETFGILTGRTLPEKRAQIFNDHQILFYTPQTLRNDLVNKRYTLQKTALLIFDEAHHSSGDYPYTMISDEYIVSNPDGIILGLTASPGASKKKINSLCENLHIPVENIHIRNRKDEDVKTYLKPMDIYKIGVTLTSLMEDIYKLITLVLEERLIYLLQNGFLEVKGENLISRVVRKDLLRLNGELCTLLQNSEDKTGLYSALSINAQALKLYHMLELIEQQGLDILLVYFETLYKESMKTNCSKATRILASDQRLYNVYIELKKNADYYPEHLVHPKFAALVKILLQELENRPSSRILVFTKLRNSVKNIETRLKEIKHISPKRFVGQTTKSSEDKGLSQKRQIEILDSFKGGKYNVLISTNVGEEGLDIAECDLVVFYDVVVSEIRYIQRKGRTARHREGKVVILYSKNTRDEIYLRIVLNKLRKMNFNLKDPNQLNESYKDMPNPVEISTDVKTLPQEEENPLNSLPQKIVSGHKQSSLTSFLNKSTVNETSIQLSKYIPLKFGLRKKLNKDNYAYTTIHSEFHIVIFNKLLIQIFNPQEIQEDQLLHEIHRFSQKFLSYIIIFDFIDYQETFEGEKRACKRKYQEFGKTHNFQAIGIEIEEELYFIVKSILEAQTQKIK